MTTSDRRPGRSRHELARPRRTALGRAGVLITAAASLTGVAACPPTALPPPAGAAPAPRVAPVEPAPDPLADGPIGRFRSKRFGLVVPLPDGTGFRIDDPRSPWLVASHAGSGSTLRVRRFRERDIVNRDRCEARARELASLPTLDDAEVLELRSLAAPTDHDTQAAVYVRPVRGKPGVEGGILAFGGWARQCFAYVFTTSAEGPDAARLVAARLSRRLESSLAGVADGDPFRPSVEPR